MGLRFDKLATGADGRSLSAALLRMVRPVQTGVRIERQVMIKGWQVYVDSGEADVAPEDKPVMGPVEAGMRLSVRNVAAEAPATGATAAGGQPPEPAHMRLEVQTGMDLVQMQVCCCDGAAVLGWNGWGRMDSTSLHTDANAWCVTLLHDCYAVSIHQAMLVA